MSALNALSLTLADERATRALGAALAETVPAGVVCLYGELGAGKTTLVRGLLRHLGHAGAVRSPTYTLVETYEPDGRRVHHLDLYRLGDPEELEFIGLRDLLQPADLVLVEWPERGEGVLPAPVLSVTLSHTGEAREARLQRGGGADSVDLRQVHLICQELSATRHSG